MFLIHGNLKPKAPFNFEHTLNFLEGVSAIKKSKNKENSIIRALMFNGNVVGIKIENGGLIQDPRIKYTLFSNEDMSSDTEREIVSQINFFLSLNDDLNLFYEMADDDIIFKRIIDDLYGFHHPKFLNPFESACWAVISQRTNMKFAYKLRKGLIDYFSNKIEIEGKIYYAFPSPEQFLDIGDEILNNLLKNKRKTIYFKEIARAFSEVNEEFLKNGTVDELRRWLLSIKGIGEFSAELELIRGLGKMEVLPTHDKRLLNCYNEIYGAEKDNSDMKVISDKYNGYRGYWALYLRVYCQNK